MSTTNTLCNSNNKHFLKFSTYSRTTSNILGLTILYININRLQHKLTQIEHLLYSFRQQVDIIILTETFLFDSDTMSYNLSNYRAWHNTRENRDGGGISVYSHVSLDFTFVYKQIEQENEVLVIRSKTLNVLIAGVYKPPHTCTATFTNIFDSWLAKFKNIIMIGDMNHNLLKVNDSQIANYNAMLAMNGYHVINKIDKQFATRIQGSSYSIIDHILSTRRSTFYVYYGDTQLSDHRLLLTKFELKEKTIIIPVSKTKTNYKNVVKNILDTFYASPINNFDHFYYRLTDTIKTNTITTTDKLSITSYKKPWFNKNLDKLAKIRDKFYKLHKKYPSNAFISEAFAESQTNFKKTIIKRKQEFYAKKFTDNITQPKKMWSLVRNIITNNNDPTDDNDKISLEIDNIIISNPKIVSEKFVQYFSNVAINLTKNYPPNFSFHCPSPDVACNNTLNKFNPTTEEEVTNIIKGLDSNSATGYDGISIRLVKELIHIIVPLLTNAINNWIKNNQFPDFLKIATITPIFKAGNRLDISNYRPISVLCVFCKIFERILNLRLLDYLYTNNLINHNQFGFTKHSSTVSASLNLIETVYRNIEMKNASACLLLDLKKAFDCVDHNILLRKLSSFGIIADARQMIIEYLKNRKHHVKVGQSRSNEHEVLCGIPQGSVLGPTLFLLYINDIFKLNLIGHLQLFADDAALVYGSPNHARLKTDMAMDLLTINQWLYNNKLILNVSKTNFIIFYLKHPPPDIFDEIIVSNDVLKRVESINYLGLVLNSQLSWTNHINHIKSKVAPMIGALRRVSRFIPQYLRYNLYFSYIHSHFLYLIQVWGSTTDHNINDLQVLQNKSLKAVRNLDMLTPTKLLYDNKILPVTKLIDYEYLITIYKIKFNLLKSNLSLNINYGITGTSTRNCLNYRLPNYKLASTQNSILYKGVQLFNNLDSDIKVAKISQFKSSVKTKLLEEFVEEYNRHHR